VHGRNFGQRYPSDTRNWNHMFIRWKSIAVDDPKINRKYYEMEVKQYPYECAIIMLFLDRNRVNNAVTSREISVNWYASQLLGAELWPWPTRSMATILLTVFWIISESNCDLHTSTDPPTPCIRKTVTPNAVSSAQRKCVSKSSAFFSLRVTMQTRKRRWGRSSMMSE